MKCIKHLIYYGIFKYYKWIIDRSDKKIKKLELKLRVEKHFNKDMTEKELEIHNRKKELLRMLGDIHREIVFGDLEDEGFRNMLRESLRIIMKKI